MFCEIKVVNFRIDLDVIKTKIVSLSKKLSLVVSIASPGSFRLSEHLSCAQADVGNLLLVFFIVFFLRIALKRPYNK